MNTKIEVGDIVEIIKCNYAIINIDKKYLGKIGTVSEYYELTNYAKVKFTCNTQTYFFFDQLKVVLSRDLSPAMSNNIIKIVSI